MNLLQFLFGKDFNKGENVPFTPGSFYLDLSKGELWIDDPTNNTVTHSKIIDTDTLIYEVEENGSMLFPAEDNAATARLGVARLGVMKLGNSG